MSDTTATRSVQSTLEGSNLTDGQMDTDHRLTPASKQVQDAGMVQAGRAALYKLGALVLFVVQNSALALAMRYSRTVSGKLYISSTAVVLAECLKLILATGLVFCEERTMRKVLEKLHREIVLRPDDLVKLLVPAGLYTIQNNLAYVAVSNLDAASYQVLSQLKILTTAVFSVLLLKRRLACCQWFSLFVLIAGVSVLQLAGLQDASFTNNSNLVGLLSVLLACCSSGYAGVYFEHVLKGSDVSVWVRKIQMAISGIFVGLIGVYCNDLLTVTKLGFFHGYSSIVWGVISLQAIYGVVVAVVIKLADNLLKGFAMSISIIVSCVCTFFLFSEPRLNHNFLLGTSLVLMATVFYSAPTAKVQTTPCFASPVPSPSHDQAPLLLSDMNEEAMIVQVPCFCHLAQGDNRDAMIGNGLNQKNTYHLPEMSKNTESPYRIHFVRRA